MRIGRLRIEIAIEPKVVLSHSACLRFEPFSGREDVCRNCGWFDYKHELRNALLAEAEKEGYVRCLIFNYDYKEQNGNLIRLKQCFNCGQAQDQHKFPEDPSVAARYGFDIFYDGKHVYK